ncbi:proto-oncogene tyrosine-protein kinase receptor Ret-like [Pecten maximus]|uniref:proto-oncogene tyrosine-protein kinase receptor Ret-like n=1 Tax=Pecten maximus TaxID=6579 RepID=UPI001457FF91|nr:proto-oncogene tyrosine-protein kinase receptor Ret-like [Pecten maximus]
MTGETSWRCCWIGLLLTLPGVCGIYFTKQSYQFCADIRPGVVVGRIQTLQNISHHCEAETILFHTVDLGTPTVGFRVNASGWIYVATANSSVSTHNKHIVEVSVSCAGEFSGKVPVTINPKDQCSCRIPRSNSTSWISDVCFQTKELYFIVEENTESVRLGNVAPCEFVNGFNRTYTISSEYLSDKLEVDGASSEMFLLSTLDREVVEKVSFTLQCSVSRDGRPVGESSANVLISVGDTNDNPILFQNNTDKATVDYNTDRQWYSMILNDRDLLGCDHHQTYVSLDPRGACSHSTIDMGYHLGSGPLRHVVCRLKVQVEREKISDRDEYTCMVAVTDPGYKPFGTTKYSNESIVTVNIKMDRTTSSSPSEVYTAMVVEGAARLTRIHTFGEVWGGTPRSYFSNSQASPFGVTRYDGIVYVDKPGLLEGSRQQNFTVSAFTTDEKREQKIVLTVKILRNSKKKTQCNESCSRHDGREGCVSSCGLGLLAKTCIWRMGEKGVWTTKYGTCTYDKKLCPNNICDELENQHPQLCPQDCTNKTVGAAKLNTNPPRGIAEAVGNCFCSYTGECSCAAEDLSPRITLRPRDSTLIKIPQLDNVAGQTDNTTDHDHHVTNGQLYYRPKEGGIETSGGGCDENCRTTTAATLGCLGAVTCIFVLAWRLRKRRCQNSHNIKKRVGSLVSVSAIPSDYQDDRDIHRNYHVAPPSSHKGPLDYTPTPEDMKWEFERDKLILDKTLGEGEFGRVVKAKSYNLDGKDGYKDVAVKMLKHCASSSELSDLLSEFNLLKDVNHPNVIRLLGACTRDGPFYVIVEYCEYGSLLSFLRRSRLEENGYVNHRYRHKEFTQHCENGEYMEPELLSIGDLLSFAWQIAKGMKYLSEIKLVHRDLAARNVLVAAGKVLKISDFGLTRDVYEADTYLKQSKGRIPVKWLAPESLYAQIYTTQSDVWSFGIVLWEIVTLGAPPYPGIPPERLYNLLIAGYRMDRPESCTDELYAVMQKCWKTDPSERPPFIQLTNIFDRLLQQRTEYLDLTGGTVDDTVPDVYDKCFGNALGKVFPKQNQPRQADLYGSISVISGNSEPYLTPSTSKPAVDPSDSITTQNTDNRRVVLHSNEDSTRLPSRKCLDLKSSGGEKLALLLDSGTAVFSPSSDTDEDPDSRETDVLSVQRC